MKAGGLKDLFYGLNWLSSLSKWVMGSEVLTAVSCSYKILDVCFSFLNAALL